MSGTNHTTTGFRRITRLDPPVKMRLLGFVVVIISGTLLISWIADKTWEQLSQLQKEHAAVRGEGFYLGVSMRGTIRSLNDKVLQYSITGDPEIRSAFLQESEELKSRIETNSAHLAQIVGLQIVRTVEFSKHLELLQQSSQALEHYLAETTPILERSPTPASPVSFEQVYRKVREASSDFVGACDQLVKLQREEFGNFLEGTQDTLASHQRLLKLTLGLILALAGALALLVYRGMIAPLLVGLSKSQSLIERQEKLASLGVLASGVAHEIRNPLTAIKFRLFSLKKAVPALSSNTDAAVIGNEINRLERIVKDFLQFARPSDPELASIPARQLLKEAHALYRGQLERAAIQLQIQAADGEGWVHADAPQIKQVLINLIQNAAESIGRNGTISLRLRKEEVDLEGRSRPAVILSVSDNGKGIPPEVEARLFDPFFTTKEGGTGLGLAIAARIIEKHGGLLRYETQVNRGTTFEIVLPAIDQEPAKLVAGRN